MLAKKYRLRGEKRFREIHKNGRRFFTRLLNLRYLENNEGCPRFALVVSAKISKKATQRNKIRRQLLEIIRQELPRFDKKYDYLIKVKLPLLDLEPSERKKALITLFERTKLWL